ncbi:MAG: TerB family tellurite resistance protein [Geopsychrobacter sp.]|nr:TerB family tellurite resistance protein [Geopsychrobacter sp.]
MLKKILALLAPTHEAPHPDRIPLAAAVLLLEIAYADGDFSEKERALIQDLLQKRFDLDDETRGELLKLAEEAKRESSDLHQFTRQINHNFSQPEKEEIILSFWSLAFADGHLDAYEEAMLRQLGSLIGISHRQLIDAKLKVRKELEISSR